MKIILNGVDGIKPGATFSDPSEIAALEKSGAVFVDAALVPEFDKIDKFYSKGDSQGALFTLLALYAKGQASQGYRFSGISGIQTTTVEDGTSWVTVGSVRINPAEIASGFVLSTCVLHADLTVAEETPSSVICRIKLVDDTLTDILTLQTSLGGASIVPEHVSGTIPLGSGSGMIDPAIAKTYTVQISRLNGGANDSVSVLNCYVETVKGLKMTLPTLAKTWQFSTVAFNLAIPAQGSAGATNKRIMRTLKNALIGFPSNPWTVVSSSNSIVANSSDNWNSDADIVNSGGAHSWIVLEQAGINGNFQVCIDCNNATASFQIATIVISNNAGFTGGSTSARPTATDETVIINIGNWTGISTDIASRLSVMQSSDGECTRIYLAASGTSRMLCIFDKPAQPVTGWVNPSYTLWILDPTFANMFSNYNGKMRHSSTNGNAVMTTEGYGTVMGTQDTAWGNIPNEISSEWNMFTVGIASNTVGCRGRHGYLYDLWTGSASIATGDSYPGDASNQFAQFGTIILPWNGGAINLS